MATPLEIPSELEVISQVSGRERQLLEHSANGLTDKQISIELGISNATIASYWRRLLRKFDAASRTELVARFSRHQVLLSLTELESSNNRLLQEVSDRTESQAKELAQRNLLSAISDASLSYINSRYNPRQVFERFLENILELTDSEYGFIGQVLLEDGVPYLKEFALTNIAWSTETAELYEKHHAEGLEFRNLETLFGRVMTTGMAIIANDAPNDPRRGGLPEGHPPLDCFLGIPVYSGPELIGMIGLGNRPGGYSLELIDFLRPIIDTCSTLLAAYLIRSGSEEFARRIQQADDVRLALLDEVPMGILYETVDRKIVCTNRHLGKMFGITADLGNMEGLDCESAMAATAPLLADPKGFAESTERLVRGTESKYGEKIRLASGVLLERDFIMVKDGARTRGFLWCYRIASPPVQPRR
jgi:DNA-binding CsgD family transcriptional regulator/GAF domain-containing protein